MRLAGAAQPADNPIVSSAFGRMAAAYADICSLAVDAIVNPAHRDLLGGGGLEGMIHDAAGPELLEACRRLGACGAGDAKVTPGYGLPVRWIIHTVGPIWRGGGNGEDTQLASCYRRCLEEAAGAGAETLAFPGISTGLHRFPVELAARIAVGEVSHFLETSTLPRGVLFACFDNSSLAAYEKLLRLRC